MEPRFLTSVQRRERLRFPGQGRFNGAEVSNLGATQAGPGIDSRPGRFNGVEVLNLGATWSQGMLTAPKLLQWSRGF